MVRKVLFYKMRTACEPYIKQICKVNSNFECYNKNCCSNKLNQFGPTFLKGRSRDIGQICNHLRGYSCKGHEMHFETRPVKTLNTII